MSDQINTQINNQSNQSVISNLSHDGRGVVTNNGKKVFVDGVLPGETVTWVYVKQHRRYDEAKVDKVIVPSSGRAVAICPNFLTCGGCSYQHMTADNQLAYKQEIVRELLEHIGNGVKPGEWLVPLHAQTSGYRTKARLGVKYVIKKDKILIGFREKSSNYITQMQECPILHRELDKLIKPLGELIATLSIYHKIAQIEFAMGDYNPIILGRNIAIIFRNLEEFNSNDKDCLVNFAKIYNVNLLLQPSNPDSVYCLHGTSELSYKFSNEIGYEINYKFHPQDFTQVNLEINSLMLKQAISLLKLNGDESILDLFCGLGNFTLAFAKELEANGGKVHGIEGSDLMVSRALENAKLNNISNVSFERLDLYNNKNESLKTSKVNSNYDCVILDPPRSGALEVLPYIGSKENNINKILYVSCNPSTFARDVGILCNDYGYKLEKVGIMDMFPHTKHIETIGLLIRK